jgi:hypothetical protein
MVHDNDQQMQELLLKIDENNDNQLKMMQMLIQGQLAIIEALTTPKRSVIKISKDAATGGFVGSKTEG